jgi:hypothetical protein
MGSTGAEEQNECEFDDAYADGPDDAEAQNALELEDACANEPEGSQERNESEFGDARLRRRHRGPSTVREG